MQNTIARIAKTVQKAAAAMSNNIGKDCLWHAMAAQALFMHLGFLPNIKIGFAAWRIGNDDGAVILHAPEKGRRYEPNEIPFHAWIEFENMIFDPTTYQLGIKAKQLEEIDGIKTDVIWQPPYLYVDKILVSNLRSVIQNYMVGVVGFHGLFYYEEIPDLSKFIWSNPEELPMWDYSYEYNLLTTIYENPEVKIIVA